MQGGSKTISFVGAKFIESNENAFNVMNLEEFLEENNIQVNFRQAKICI